MKITNIKATVLQQIDDNLMFGLENGEVLVVTITRPHDAPRPDAFKVCIDRHLEVWATMHPAEDVVALAEKAPFLETETVNMEYITNGVGPAIMVGFSRMLKRWFKRPLIY